MKNILILTLMIFLTSCSMFKKEEQREPLPPVKIITEIITPELYAPPLPRVVQIENIEWFVLTRNADEDNIEEQIAEVERVQGPGNFVVFAMTPQAYENMAANLQDIKRYIAQTQEIILYFMEATAPQGKEGWLAETQARRQALEEAVVPEPEPEEKAPLFGIGDIFKIF
jgi:hypothetical protein